MSQKEQVTEQVVDEQGKVIPQENEVKAKEPIKARNFRKTARKEIEKSYAQILKALADGAAEGNVQHTKLLFELGGIKEEVAKPERRRSTPTLGKYLLKEAIRLGRIQPKKGQGQFSKKKIEPESTSAASPEASL